MGEVMNLYLFMGPQRAALCNVPVGRNVASQQGKAMGESSVDVLEQRAQLPRYKRLVDRFLHDQPFADTVTLCAGAFGNLALAMFNGILCGMNPSLWLGAMTAYFVALLIMSSLVAASTGSDGKLPWRVVAAVCGVVLVTLSGIVALIMCLCIAEGHNDAPPEFAILALAAFTFYNSVVAIVTATKTMKGNLRQQTLLRVSMAGTIGALLILEMQMFGTYASLADPQLIVVMEAVSGAVGALLLLLMGCSLIAKQRRYD